MDRASTSYRNVVMDKNKRLLIQFAKKCNGQLCIAPDLSIVRLIGWSEDAMDYYYKCRMLGLEKPDSVIHHSFVWRMIPLKSKLSKKDYKCLDDLFALNCKEEYEEAYKRLRKEAGYKE